MICAVCFGDPSSLVTQGYNYGILSLLGVVIAVLIGFVFLFINISNRSRRSPLC